MAPLRSPSERAALSLYLFLLATSLGLVIFDAAPPVRWASQAAAALYTPFRAVSVSAAGLRAMLVRGERLRADSAELRRTRALLAEMSEENERLRQQAEFGRRDSLHLIPAWILAKRLDRLGTRVLIDRGSLDSVRVGYAVVNRDGLVGRVDALEGHISRVRLLTDRASAVSARVLRSRVDGVLEGDPLEGLRLRFVSTSSDVRVGDAVVTSGLGGVFPAGILVGTVKSLGLEEGGLLRSIRVTPVAPAERVEDVFVLAVSDSAKGWGYLWERPAPPVDTLAESMRSDRVTP